MGTRRKRSELVEPEMSGGSVAAARSAGLRYVSDTQPGISRKRSGKSFSYRRPDGRLVRDRETLAWIRSIAIPPAWVDVWISPVRNGHVLATGRDARGRKQHRYHPRRHEVRDDSKYSRTIALADALPKIRARTKEDLRKHGLPRQKVIAAVIQLLEKTTIRVGNEEYAQTNRSYGLTTMRDKHVVVEGSSLRFEFRGKSGKYYSVSLRDRRLARIVRECQKLPGGRLFQYVDDEGVRRSIDSDDVNDYLREASGRDFTAKDFRTWAGTVLAYEALGAVEAVDSEAAAKRQVVEAVEAVATRLGNTPAVSRKSYIHPGVIESHLDGTLLETLRDRTETELEEEGGGLDPRERGVMVLLQDRLGLAAKEAGKPAGKPRHKDRPTG